MGQDQDHSTLWIVLLIIVLLVYRGGGTTSKPPFETDKLAVAVFHNADDAANLPQWVNATAPGSVQAWTKANGGDFRIIHDKADVSLLDKKWQDAAAVERKSVPWITAATPSKGVSQAITTEAATLQALEPLKGQ